MAIDESCCTSPEEICRRYKEEITYSLQKNWKATANCAQLLNTGKKTITKLKAKNEAQITAQFACSSPFKSNIVMPIIWAELEQDSQFKSLSEEEKRLLKIFSQNTEQQLVHLFGNKTAKPDEANMPLEGVTMAHALDLFLVLMKRACCKHPAIFSQRNENLWEGTKKMFSKALCYAKYSLSALGHSTVSKRELHEKLVEEILRDFHAMAEEEQMGIPWGWSRKEGHGMFLIISKKEAGYVLQLYNTGEGKRYHPMITHCGTNLWVNRIGYKINSGQVARFRTFLSHILEPGIFGYASISKESLDFQASEYSAEQLYGYLNQYERTISEVNREEWWSQGSVNGICAFKCLHAVFGYLIPDLSDAFRVFYCAEVLRLLFAFDKYLIAPNETVQRILSHALPHFARRLNKPIKNIYGTTLVTVDELEIWSALLHAR